MYSKFVISASLSINILALFYIYNPKSPQIPEYPPRNQLSKRLDLRNAFFNSSEFKTKDYVLYNCKNSRRIGGAPKLWVHQQLLSKIMGTTPYTKEQRVEGGLFICFDPPFAPIKNNCNVLSFGINKDDSFDFEMNKYFGCVVHSFDPFIESSRFAQIRNQNPNLKDSFLIPVNHKWKFYRIGLTGSNANIVNKNKIGWLDTLENIIEMTDLKNKVIDVFKIDIEGAEMNVLENFNIDYACKYYKQFVIETHAPSFTNNLYVLMSQLNKCFSLFRRDTRLIGPKYGGEYVSEVAKSNFNINLKLFENEINLVNFLLSTGELYFVNENFI